MHAGITNFLVLNHINIEGDRRCYDLNNNSIGQNRSKMIIIVSVFIKKGIHKCSHLKESK